MILIAGRLYEPVHRQRKRITVGLAALSALQRQKHTMYSFLTVKPNYLCRANHGDAGGRFGKKSAGAK